MSGLPSLRLGEFAEEVSRRVGDAGGIPVYAVTKHAGFVPSSDYFRKRVHSADVSGYKLVHQGEFAYATIHLDEGSLGLLTRADRAAISPMYTVFRVDPSRVWGPYLFRFLKSPAMIARYGDLGKGTVHRRRSIPFERLARLEVPLPPLDTQKRVAAVLDKAEAISRKRIEATALTDDLLRSAFLVMFGDPFSNPMGWPEWSIDQACEDLSYGTSRKCSEKPLKHALPVLRIPNILGGHIDWTDLKYAALSGREVDNLLLREGDLLFVRTNGNPDYIARCSVFTGDRRALFASYLLRLRLRTDAPFLPEYLQLCFSLPAFRSQLRRLTRTTAGNYNLSASSLRSLVVPAPPLREQQRLAAVSAQVLSHQRALAEAAKLDRQLFASLSQRAFRGEL